MKNYYYATIKERFLAYLIDSIIIALISSLLMRLLIPIFQFDENSMWTSFDLVLDEMNEYIINPVSDLALNNAVNEFMKSVTTYSLINALATGITIFLYCVVLGYYLNTQTLGRKAMRIKVVNVNGNKIKFTNLLGREGVYFIIFNLPGASTILMIINIVLICANGYSLIDLLSKTRLVSMQSAPESDDQSMSSNNPYDIDPTDYDEVHIKKDTDDSDDSDKYKII